MDILYSLHIYIYFTYIDINNNNHIYDHNNFYNLNYYYNYQLNNGKPMTKNLD